LVRPGDPVVVLESGKVISMRLSGRAMEAGGRGDQVRVRITAVPNGAIVSGTVSGQDEVSLNDLPEGGSQD
jgi:flagella basal body P-ring formation protein FlgA